MDAIPYLNRTAFTLFIDTNIIGSDDQSVLALRRLREEGWINLQRTDTMDTEFLTAPPELWVNLTEESSRYPETFGPLILDHSRLGSSILGDDEDEARLHSVFAILYPGAEWGEARKNHVRDAMHVATSIRYGGDGFVTYDKRMLNKYNEIAAQFGGFRILSPAQAVEEALGRVASLRELHRREPHRGELPEWPQTTRLGT
ncbi:type II toxin-antitoxin system VapC family toxin [Nonomuraea sp. C10]|uniref:type II toxin-antitoxin system VapC family toxin n=1 Tax=Nonomuraea sp. C10 TaxID=2600577 RepID=UPI0011CE066A|nr:type II toxin-antitoxin system VapC family toxin [Nonomuraea sp. C10]TXK34260.1 type II toxin-antitoxin system VapC family toxin [Nonomuraea sp. C10]